MDVFYIIYIYIDCNGKSQQKYYGENTATTKHHPYCECDTSRKGHKCEIPTCVGNKLNSWFSPVPRLSICSDMGKCDASERCICRNGYGGTYCSQSIYILLLYIII